MSQFLFNPLTGNLDRSNAGGSGGPSYLGTWNASTNTPTIVSGVGVTGQYYIVSVAGTTTIDGLSNWDIGDWIIFNGTAWEKLVGTGVFFSAVGSSPNVYGATSVGQDITLQPANTSFPGVLLASDWNTFNNKQPAGNYITALTGDITASGPGSAPATLTTVNSNIGTFPKVTVNAKGLVTAATTLSSGDIPNNAANTTGTAANITATSNSTLTTISSLSLPGSQVTGNISGNSGGFTGSLSGDVTGGQSATAIASTTVTGKVLTGYVSGAGTVSATDSILTAIEKLNGNTAALVTGVSSVNGSSGAVTVNAINQLTGDVTTSAASQSQSEASTVAAIQGTTVSGTTGSGNVVFSNSPTLVTPALGTPSAVVLTNATGTASSLTAGNINATSNSTLTTLPSLSLPASQLSGTISLTSQVSGILPVANGGTGNGTFTTNAIPYFNGTTFSDGSTNIFWNNGSSFLGLNGGIQVNAGVAATIGTTASTAGSGALTVSSANAGGTAGNIGGLVTISGGNGAPNSTAGTSAVAGSGAGVQIIAGAGGNASNGTTIDRGGSGGGISLNAGNAGSSSGAGSGSNQGLAGGSITAQAGTGGTLTGTGVGSTNTAGAGGGITYTAGTGGGGAGGAITGANGGAVSFTSGQGGSGGAGHAAGNAGTVTFTGANGGASAVSSAGTNTGGNGATLALVSGSGGSASNGGTNVAGSPGPITVTAGNGGTAASGTGQNGANITLTGGNGTNGSSNATNGGSVVLQGGAAHQSGTAGYITLNATGGNVGIGTTTPGSPLTVVGATSLDSGAITTNASGTFTAGVWNGTAITGTYIASNTVTNSNLAQVGANTLKGNNTGSTANVADLTVSQVQAMLGISPASAGDIAETSFSAANNTANQTITSFAFANASVRSFKALVSVYVNATTSLVESFDIQGAQSIGSGWTINVSSLGDNSGATFSINSSGQMLITTSNYSGFVAATVKFRAQTTSV